jgi:dedicator of cytokinesis protein 3
MTTMDQIRMLEWSDEVLARTPFEGYPEEPERVRREKLYRAAIQDFVDGEDYERAIARCEELRHYYQHQIYDYDKLAAILTEEAEYFKKVIHTERFYMNYFRVCYHGEGFDEELREKEFVYRGVKLEPVMDFTNRIKKKYPEAKILMSSEKPSDDLYAAHKQIISITTLVKPTDQERLDLTGTNNAGEKKEMAASPRNKKKEVKEGSESAETKESKSEVKQPPAPIQRYRENNDLRVFSYSKAVQKSTEKKPANEFKTLWVTKTYIFTRDAFPANRRRMEVVERKEVFLSPIENAVGTMNNKNQDLEVAIEAVEKAPPGPVDVGPLSMLLNGMIDAAVNGGTNKYIDAFLSEEFMQTKPDAQQLALRQELKQSLRDQIACLKRGLAVFGQRCDQKLKGLFDHLSGFYEQMVNKTKAVVA